MVAEEDLEQPQDSADEGEVEPVDEPEEIEEEVSADAEATQDDAYSIDDLEDIMVTHKIDGEDVTLPLSEWVAGSATKQHLSKQGRELGEARKSLDEERAAKLGELEQLSAQLAYATQHEEQQLAQEYHDVTQKLNKAMADDDTYEIGELTRDQKKAQEKYWEVRSKREGAEQEVTKQMNAARQEQFARDVEHFHQEIPNYVEGWNEDVAQEVREFALEEGLPEVLVDTMTNPAIVKFVHKFYEQSKGIKTGAKKRAATPTKKVPAKKQRSVKQKQASKENLVVAKGLNPNSTPQDQHNFLKQHVEKNSLQTLLKNRRG